MICNHSVPSPLPSARKCPQLNYHNYSVFPALSDSLLIPYIPEARVNRTILCVLRVAALYGSRISELLSTTVADYLAVDRVFCKGRKGGASYVVFLPGLSAYISETPNISPQTKIFGATYMACYRACINLGIAVKFKNNTRNSCTHLGRHRLAASIINNKSERDAGDCLHHRSHASITYYSP